MQPLVSIILPTYNGEKYLRTSLDSCLAQTYKHFELIVVNDCSKDNTIAIALEYQKKDSRVKVIDNTVNKKLPQSLNTGFNAAQGIYYTWTSDDNYYAPNAIEVLVNTLIENPTADLVYANYTEINDDGKVIGTKYLGNINASFTKWIGCGACFMYKKEVHEKNKGYDPSTFLIEDYDFFLRSYLYGTFLYLERFDLYFYRLHAESLTGTMSSAVFDIQKILIEKKITVLLPKLIAYDTMLLYRKFTVYYALFKNNTPKANHYLNLLYKQSAVQACITVIYIALKKAGQYFGVVFSLTGQLIKLPFTSGK